nr:hypothetical protein [Mesorhizobium ciceri]
MKSQPWFVSIATLDASMKATEIDFREVIPVPYGPSDLQVLLGLNTNIRAMA